MKKIKLITSLAGLTGLTAGIIPAFASCSCAKKNEPEVSEKTPKVRTVAENATNTYFIIKQSNLDEAESTKVKLVNLKVNGAEAKSVEGLIKYTTDSGGNILVTFNMTIARAQYGASKLTFDLLLTNKKADTEYTVEGFEVTALSSASSVDCNILEIEGVSIAKSNWSDVVEYGQDYTATFTLESSDYMFLQSKCVVLINSVEYTGLFTFDGLNATLTIPAASIPKNSTIEIVLTVVSLKPVAKTASVGYTQTFGDAGIDLNATKYTTTITQGTVDTINVVGTAKAEVTGTLTVTGTNGTITTLASQTFKTTETTIKITLDSTAWGNIVNAETLSVTFTKDATKELVVEGEHNVDINVSSTLSFTAKYNGTDITDAATWTITNTDDKDTPLSESFDKGKLVLSEYAQTYGGSGKITCSYTPANSNDTIEKDWYVEIATFDKLLVDNSESSLTQHCAMQKSNDTSGNIVIPARYYDKNASAGNEWVDTTKTRFFAAENITGIVFGKNVTDITFDQNLFVSNITQLAVNQFNSKYTSIAKVGGVSQQCNCVIDTTTNTLGLGCANTVIPDDGSVTIIGPYAFKTKIKTLTLPAPVKTIKNYAFYFSSITSISTADSSALNTIESHAFYGASSLTEANFSKVTNLASIGAKAFERCNTLAVVELPTANYVQNNDSYPLKELNVENSGVNAKHFLDLSGDEYSPTGANWGATGIVKTKDDTYKNAFIAYENFEEEGITLSGQTTNIIECDGYSDIYIYCDDSTLPEDGIHGIVELTADGWTNPKKIAKSFMPSATSYDPDFSINSEEWKTITNQGTLTAKFTQKDIANIDWTTQTMFSASENTTRIYHDDDYETITANMNLQSGEPGVYYFVAKCGDEIVATSDEAYTFEYSGSSANIAIKVSDWAKITPTPVAKLVIEPIKASCINNWNFDAEAWQKIDITLPDKPVTKFNPKINISDLKLNDYETADSKTGKVTFTYNEVTVKTDKLTITHDASTIEDVDLSEIINAIPEGESAPVIVDFEEEATTGKTLTFAQTDWSDTNNYISFTCKSSYTLTSESSSISFDVTVNDDDWQSVEISLQTNGGSTLATWSQTHDGSSKYTATFAIEYSHLYETTACSFTITVTE